MVLNKLRNKHATGYDEGQFYGVDVNNQSGICNTYETFVWEPILVRHNALQAATEVNFMTLPIFINIYISNKFKLKPYYNH